MYNFLLDINEYIYKMNKQFYVQIIWIRVALFIMTIKKKEENSQQINIFMPLMFYLNLHLFDNKERFLVCQEKRHFVQIIVADKRKHLFIKRRSHKDAILRLH